MRISDWSSDVCSSDLRFEAIRADAVRHVAVAATALVRRDHAVAGRGERADLSLPDAQRVGEAVQQHDHRSFTGYRDIEAQAIGLDAAGLDGVDCSAHGVPANGSPARNFL